MSASTSSTTATLALPIVAGLTFKEAGRIAKIGELIETPNAKSWDAMLEQLRLSGDKTSVTTPQGFHHPCQTDDLRCDHQGEINTNYINTQVQLGGRDKRVTRKANQSTTVSQVNVHYQAYNSSFIKDALARSHDYSFRTLNVVQIDSVAAASRPVVAAPTTFTCNVCGKKYVAMDNIALGLQLAGYPPRCSCGGTPVRG